jgi:transketolase
MLLYSVLHLAGVEQLKDGKPIGELAVPLEHIKKFRQLHSRCPGHPEHFETTGVEITTGPLGQGIATSVGFAIAERWMAAHFNKPGFELFNYNIYAMCSDGDLMEGISQEAASIAGHLQLSNLCWIYDDNHITIEGHTDLAFGEDVGKRFEGNGWNVIKVADANDLPALRAAYKKFRETTDKPTLIIVRSHIGYGAPHKQDTHEAHGAPLGADEIKLAKKFYNWPEDAQFLVPDEVTANFAEGIGARGKKASVAWREQFKKYAAEHADLAKQWQAMESRELPAGWDKDIPVFPTDAKGMGSRIAGGKALNAIAKNLPWMVGGAGDLAPSTMTMLTFEDAKGSFEPDNYIGRNMHFGIREHGMAAAVNGMCLSYLRSYGATFFVFSDYLRPSMRLASIMQLPSIFIFTHDSIGVGEDGPTHQPIEHLAACRAIPGLIVLRPGDANEVSEAWRTITPLKDRPVALVLSRQNLPTLDRTKYAPASGTKHGAYVLADAAGGKPDVILMATGSELQFAVEAHEQLTKEGVKSRLVSMPSWELFADQDAAYRESVLPTSVTARVAVEAAESFGWERFLGARGKFVGMKSFGASAPAGTLYKFFGITAEHVVSAAKESLATK